MAAPSSVGGVPSEAPAESVVAQEDVKKARKPPGAKAKKLDAAAKEDEDLDVAAERETEAFRSLLAAKVMKKY